MNIEIQIQSIVVSAIYGLLSSFIYNFLYFLLYNKYIIIRLLFNFIFSIVINSMLFLLLYFINNGVVHIYFVIIFLFGFYIGNKNTNKIRFDLKKSK